MTTIANKILEIYKNLSVELDALTFLQPVECVYNPLKYAWSGFEFYINKFAHENTNAVFVGMNPGPYGMAQTGVPFGEISAVKNFLHVPEFEITPPEHIHPKYLIQGFKCRRHEVSGQRLWTLIQDKFLTAEKFFAENIILNYCPLMFIGEHNLTPDKLKRQERKKLYSLCNAALNETLILLNPKFAIGIGNFAYERLQECTPENVFILKILHPSPASPMSSKGWDVKTETLLKNSGVWP